MNLRFISPFVLLLLFTSVAKPVAAQPLRPLIQDGVARSVIVLSAAAAKDEQLAARGLLTYKGEAWYQQEVDIPQRFAGKRIFLWFGSVDEKAKVWVNGQLIGISHDATFLPFELDATAAIKSGARNVVTVRVINQRVDELGTGGLTGPVMFYAPAAGKDAKLENSQPLPPTFP